MWDHDEFVKERVERAKKLLAESEDHQGSAELQVRAAATPRLPAPERPAAARREPPGQSLLTATLAGIQLES